MPVLAGHEPACQRKKFIHCQNTEVIVYRRKSTYFYAPARRRVFVKLPEEDDAPGMRGRLNVPIYGTRDAASNLEECYAQHLIDNGFIQGKSSPCVFHHPVRKLRCVVHGDDFTFLGCDDQLDFCTKMTQDRYEVKVTGSLGPDAKDDKTMTILKRSLEWKADGIHYEADPRHAEIHQRSQTDSRKSSSNSRHKVASHQR